jgi:hypothetical protein
VNAEADLARFVARRRLDAYEQSMARLGYAYGVDVRRARFIAQSSIGNAIVRSVDRAWPRLREHLTSPDGPLRTPSADGGGVPTALLRELAEIVALLRAPTPTVALLTTPRTDDIAWPVATPLGSTHGEVHWAVLDVENLTARESDARRFALALAHVVAHLQCDHAVFFTAYLLAARGEAGIGVRALRPLLRPWARVMVFSADRAAALALGDIDRTIAAMELDEADRVGRLGRSFWPTTAPLPSRTLALREFGRSVVFARTRALLEHDPAVSILGHAGRPGPVVDLPDDAWSLARCDERLTSRLGLF